MKIHIPRTILEPLTLRWNEMFSQKDHRKVVHDICVELHRLCDLLIGEGVLQKLSISVMLALLQDNAENSGADGVWIEFQKRFDLNRIHVCTTYQVVFILPGSPQQYNWNRTVPVN